MMGKEKSNLKIFFSICMKIFAEERRFSFLINFRHGIKW